MCTSAKSHMDAFTSAHFTGRFLAFHRLLLQTLDNILAEECGYKGAIPYWNWYVITNYAQSCFVITNESPGAANRNIGKIDHIIRKIHRRLRHLPLRP